MIFHTYFDTLDVLLCFAQTNFTPQHWLMCHLGKYKFEFEFAQTHSTGTGSTLHLEIADLIGRGAAAKTPSVRKIAPRGQLFSLRALQGRVFL